jgi:hypothetical protein
VPGYLTTVLLGIAALVCLGPAKRDPTYRPLAITLGALFVADCLRWALTLVLVGPVPFTGWRRAAFHVDQTLLIGWRWGIAAGLWATGDAAMSAERKAVVQAGLTTGLPPEPGVARSATTVLLGIWIALSITLAALYPMVRAKFLLGTVHPWIHVAAVVAIGIAIVDHHLRPLRAPKGAEYPALVLAAGCACQLLGPWLYDDPVRDWWIGRWVSVITHGAAAVVIGWQVWRMGRDQRAE